MAKNSIEVTLVGGEDLLKAIADADMSVRAVLRGAVLAGAQVVADAAKGSAPGPELVAEVLQASAAGVEVGIGPDKEHWYYQFAETGAAAHEITGTPLQFEGRAGMIRTASVSHPGMAAQPFLRPAHDGTLGEQERVLGDHLRSALP